MKKLEQQELDTLQESMKKYNECKMQLGETVLRQQALMMQVTMIQKESKSFEDLLIKKYGQDSVIDMKTGEVRPSEKK